MIMLTGCAKDDSSANNNPSTNINLTEVTFPNGKKVVAETLRNDFELVRGMMFRDSLPADRGMLFVHPKEDKYQFWMYQTKIPLDMIWMDRNHRIVEIAADVQPCKAAKASDCPHYGGHEPATFVLEVNAGGAAKNNLQVGQTLDF